MGENREVGISWIAGVGLGERSRRDLAPVLKRVFPGARSFGARDLSRVPAALLAEPGGLLLLPCGTAECTALDQLRELRQTGVTVGVLLLVPLALVREGLDLAGLGAVDLLPARGFTALDFERVALTLVVAEKRERELAELRRRIDRGREARRRLEARLEKLSHQLTNFELEAATTAIRDDPSVIDRMDAEVKVAKRFAPAACMVVACEGDAEIRLRYGAEIADYALVQIAHRLSRALRAEDLIYRHRHSEFVVCCPLTPLDRSLQVAERLRCAVGAEPIRVRDRAIEASVKIVVIPADGYSGIQDLIEVGTRALAGAQGAVEIAAA